MVHEICLFTSMKLQLKWQINYIIKFILNIFKKSNEFCFRKILFLHVKSKCSSHLFSETDFESSMDDWRNKQVDTWNTHDVLYWLAAEAQRLGIPSPEIGIDRFAAAGIDGIRLQSMTEQDFCNLNRQFGNTIYCSLQNYRTESDRSSFQYDNGMFKRIEYCM